jgi:pimeloyl-ACP methyl ester carboxylesterase
MGGEEKLPVVEGVRSSDLRSVIRSVFHHGRFADAGLVRHYEHRFNSRAWRKGLLRTVRGTNSHSVREKLPFVNAPTLIICGKEDRIVETEQIRQAASGLRNFRVVTLRHCGHAAQIERSRAVNRLVLHFLTQPASLTPAMPVEPLMDGVKLTTPSGTR